ncbi:SDR family oxidoreductase [Cupriavidus pinatubonensis]|uniref:Short-chain dehydrogenase/reductase SDR n=1 Tax=Cupriavidus pinatubonensis TaxID=248026 RepID=A0ABM8WBF9_9BURK|nr:hypothetical protein [Cupriavidus pinatubonensis]CAG9164584.1 hypothetical protein LMG23994_00417 [Cupriavidus pinatubonensis]
MLIAADEAGIDTAAQALRQEAGTHVDAVQADLATPEGVQQLYDRAKGRDIDILCANAGRGLGRAFLDQDFAEILHGHLGQGGFRTRRLGLSRHGPDRRSDLPFFRID